jgi:predicted metal-dependent hydrolase
MTIETIHTEDSRTRGGTSLSGDAFHVEVVRSRRRRRTASLKFTPQGSFVLAVPADCPDTFIHRFLETRRDWMQKTRARERALQQVRTIVPGSSASYQHYSLQIEQDMHLKYPEYRVSRTKADHTSVFWLAPEFFEPQNSQKLHNQLEKYLLAQLVRHGTDDLIARAHELARQHSIKVKEIFVRVQKSRLGYCTHDDRIMLNGRLLLASNEIRDYVICHELAHTRHRNHSAKFWQYLEEIFPGARKIDKRLRDTRIYSLQIKNPEQHRS